jgi:hypothetical protein
MGMIMTRAPRILTRERLLAALMSAASAVLAGLPPEARLSSLAGAMDPTHQGMGALSANPAGLALLEGDHSGMQAHYSAARRADLSGYGALRLSPALGLGLFARWVDRGFVDVTNAAGIRRGGIVARDYNLGLGLGAVLAPRLQAGMALRGVLSQGSSDSAALEADLGVAIGGRQGWRGGLLVSGLAAGGSQPSAGDLRWGLAGPIPGAPWLQTGFAFTWRVQAQPKVHAGMELGPWEHARLRAGFEQRFVESFAQEEAGLSVGLGYERREWSIDYAWRSALNANASHNVGLSMALDQRSPRLTETTPPPPRAAPEQALDGGLLEPEADLLVTLDPLAEARRLEANGQYEAARQAYREAAARQPALAGAWRGLADLAYQGKDKAEAIQAYQRFLELEPDPELAAWLKAYQDEP